MNQFSWFLFAAPGTITLFNFVSSTELLCTLFLWQRFINIRYCKLCSSFNADECSISGWLCCPCSTKQTQCIVICCACKTRIRLATVVQSVRYCEKTNPVHTQWSKVSKNIINIVHRNRFRSDGYRISAFTKCCNRFILKPLMERRERSKCWGVPHQHRIQFPVKW